MANKSLFKTVAGKLLPKTDALNEHLAPAYALSPKAQLAQYAATGCLNHTFYADADEQLAKVIEICKGLDGVHRQDRDLRPRARLYEGHAGAALRHPVGQGREDARPHIPARDRQRQDAAQLRADSAFGRGRT